MLSTNRLKNVVTATRIGEKLINPAVARYRLSNEQKMFYTKLFRENASNGKVKRENFLPLLGFFGTQIAQDFSDRMFLVLSKGQPEITLEQYLNYIDTYHYGDIHERCLYTCKLMDTKQKGKIELEDFQSYINLIINTVKKCNNTLTKKDLMSEKDIELLFYHISKNKKFFTYSDFEKTYQEKPELVSWFDYFKNDKEDILLIINEYLPIILKIFNDFLENFISDLFIVLDEEKEINLDLIFQKLLKYSNKLDKIRNIFIEKISKFNNINEFSDLTKQKYNKNKLLFDLKNKIFESNDNNKQNINNIKNNNIDAVFNEIKRSIYNQNEKEIIINNNKNITYTINKNNSKYHAENLVKRSNQFRNKTFKFLNRYINLRSNNNTRKCYTKVPVIFSKSYNIQNHLNKKLINNNMNKHKRNHSYKINNISNYNKNNIHNYYNVNTVNNKYINNYYYRNNNQINNIQNYYLINNLTDTKNFNMKYYNNYKNNIRYANYININTNNSANINDNNINIINANDNEINYNNNINNFYSSYDNNNRYNNYNNILNKKLDAPYSGSYPNTEMTSFPTTNFYSLKDHQKLKQLLFYARVVIEKALEINAVFNNCYKWISENYLSKTIAKRMKEEKLKAKKKFKQKKLNIPRKMVPLKKNIIGAPEKSFEILFNMIMGIQIAIQATPNFHIKDKEDIKKYLTKMIYSIQTVYLGSETEETYLLKEFGGVIFNNIRLYLGINKEEFIKSISPQDFITELMISSQTIFEELCSTGSSGSLLYYTGDGEYIVKTISKTEYKFMKTMLGEYFFYIKENPLSFLPKLLGAYVLKRKYKKKTTNIYFIVMKNVFATDNHIDLRFDLKGSTIGRKVLKGTIDDTKVFSNGDMALKDLDFNKLNERVYIGQKRENVLEQIKKDIEFLYRINSNDYSLLLGIHCVKNNEIFDFSRVNTLKTEFKKEELSFLSESTKDFLLTNTHDTESNISSVNSAVNRINILKQIYDFEDGGILSKNKKRIYYFGIIDILTQFTSAKRFEYYFKKIRYCSNNMSCIPPYYYKQRFYNYLQLVFAKDSLESSSEKKININNNNKLIYNVDKYGAISSSLYKNYQNDIKDKEGKYTEEESIEKL